MIKLLILILSLVLSTAAQNDTTIVKLEAPFGLTWGSKHIAKNCEIKNQELNGLTLCSTSKVPKPVRDFERYSLIYANKKLVKVVAYSKDFTEDYYGIEGRDVYDKYKALINTKYFETSNFTEEVGLYVYRKTHEFYECIDYPGCGMYSAIWTFPDEDGTNSGIVLKLSGFGKGKGFVILSYEHSSYYKFLDDREKKEDKQNMESL